MEEDLENALVDGQSIDYWVVDCGLELLVEHFGGENIAYVLDYALNSIFGNDTQLKSAAQVHASMKRLVDDRLPTGIPPGGVGFPLCFGGHFYGDRDHACV